MPLNNALEPIRLGRLSSSPLFILDVTFTPAAHFAASVQRPIEDYFASGAVFWFGHIFPFDAEWFSFSLGVLASPAPEDFSAGLPSVSKGLVGGW